MANVFLNGATRDIETALMLEKAIVHDIGKAVAFTDGNRVFLNTDDNLFNLLPDYDPIKMKKWLLWHERFHMELRHHNRYFKFIDSLTEEDLMDGYHVTKDEVNIIMDILVHDSLSKMFPELVDTAVRNVAQMRNRNSLGYTFKTYTLEEMLEEWNKYKHGDDTEAGTTTTESKDEEEKTTEGDTPSDESTESEQKGSESSPEEETPEEETKEPTTPPKDKDKSNKPKIENTDAPAPEPMKDEHDETDWTKLEELDDKEFITKEEADRYEEEIEELKRKTSRLAKLTETLNGLVTSQRKRTYAKPNPIKIGGGVLLKGSTPGRTKLALCFDASGSMGRQMQDFKNIISKSIPQAMQVYTTWFSGFAPATTENACRDSEGRSHDYYKGKFEDFMNVHASDGYSDDGDRTIEMCYKAEQLGYTPIGVTDGGYRLSWSKDLIPKLKTTILVGQEKEWLDQVKAINPKIQTLDIDM